MVRTGERVGCIDWIVFFMRTMHIALFCTVALLLKQLSNSRFSKFVPFRY